ncbi:13042_t:CDS:1, partial [Racocetra fulgida]
NTEFKNKIATQLNGSDITILNNFNSPKLNKADDFGRSLAATHIESFITANIISSVMTSYGAAICTNDVQKVCSTTPCFCNKPIGDGNCIIAGGFGPNNDHSYLGYKDDNIALISKWRNVSDICQNDNGWNFVHDECWGRRPDYCDK